MKKYILGFVLGLALAVSGSVIAKGLEPSVSELIRLTPEQEIELGHAFSVYTGEKLEPPKKSLEVRLTELESRVSKLEAKNK